MRGRCIFNYAFMVLSLYASSLAQCGGSERWGVKDGTDPSASKVDLGNIRSVSIAELVRIEEPSLPPRNDNETRLSQETQVYKIQARLVKWKEEAGDSGDNDYHLVLTDDTLKFTQSRGAPTFHSFIGEIPDPDCLSGAHGDFGSSSPFLPNIPNSHLSIRGARSAIEAQFPNAVLDGTWNDGGGIPVEVIGVGYFDPAHGQVGRAPNNIEIHPILSISFSGQLEDAALHVTSPSATNVDSARKSVAKEAAGLPTSASWQYTMITADSTDKLLTSANALGAEGWEMVSVVVDTNRPDRYVGYLKRLKK